MTTASTITAELDRHEAEMKGLVDALKAQIAALPDNPRIKRLSAYGFVMSSKDLNNNWSAEHHNFLEQYRLIVEMIERAEPSRAVAIVRDAVAKGFIRPTKAPSNAFKLHPDVINHLKGLLA